MSVTCWLGVYTDMRQQVQDIFKKTPREKQVMFFSATLSQDIRTVCKKFMQDVRALSLPWHGALSDT